MARVELTAVAVEDLDRLTLSHSLPDDTRQRVKHSLRVLERFPLIGRGLEGRWSSYRVLLGPWRWLLFVYLYDQDKDLVLVVTIQDVRSSLSVTSV